MDLKTESAIRAITPMADQKFFIKNICRWEKYFNMESYNEGGGGISWNREALESAPLPELVEIIEEICLYKHKIDSSIWAKIKKIFRGKGKTSS